MESSRFSRRAALLGLAAVALTGCRRSGSGSGGSGNKSSREILEVGFLPVT